MTASSVAPLRAPGAAPPSMLAKVRLIVEAFELGDGRRSLAALARTTGLPKSTVLRLCGELCEWGLLERTDAGYQLGLRLWELGQRVPYQRVLREVALPHLEELLVRAGHTVHYAILAGADVLYLEKLSLEHRQPNPSQLAGRLPLHCTATGKALLAFASPSVVEQVLSSPLSRRTRHTITAPGLLARQLENVRSTGLAVEQEETSLGYLSVAAPVLVVSEIAAGAVSVTGPVGALRVERVRDAVIGCAAAIGARLRVTAPFTALGTVPTAWPA